MSLHLNIRTYPISFIYVGKKRTQKYSISQFILHIYLGKNSKTKIPNISYICREKNQHRNTLYLNSYLIYMWVRTRKQKYPKSLIYVGKNEHRNTLYLNSYFIYIWVRTRKQKYPKSHIYIGKNENKNTMYLNSYFIYILLKTRKQK